MWAHSWPCKNLLRNHLKKPRPLDKRAYADGHGDAGWRLSCCWSPRDTEKQKDTTQEARVRSHRASVMGQQLFGGGSHSALNHCTAPVSVAMRPAMSRSVRTQECTEESDHPLGSRSVSRRNRRCVFAVKQGKYTPSVTSDTFCGNC